MAFIDYRNPQIRTITAELNLERFAYDVFAYVLRICGLSESKIPNSSLGENTYTVDDFVKNVGLSALPIALYKRDDWKSIFKTHDALDQKIHSVPDLQNELYSMLLSSTDFKDEEILSQLQLSLAFYTEFALFTNGTVVESLSDLIIGCLPKLWSRLCKQLIAESEDCENNFESLFTMHPDITEQWITCFVNKCAIPYGSSDDISVRFSLYALNWPEDFVAANFPHSFSEEATHFQSADSSDETTEAYQLEKPNLGSYVSPRKGAGSPSELKEKEDVQTLEESPTCQPDLIPDDPTEAIPTGNPNLELQYSLRSWGGPSRELPNFSEKDAVQTLANCRATNGLSYVVKHCIKKRKRSITPKSVVEEFEKMELEKENISPEKRQAKRRCQISGKETIE